MSTRLAINDQRQARGFRLTGRSATQEPQDGSERQAGRIRQVGANAPTPEGDDPIPSAMVTYCPFIENPGRPHPPSRQRPLRGLCPAASSFSSRVPNEAARSGGYSANLAACRPFDRGSARWTVPSDRRGLIHPEDGRDPASAIRTPKEQHHGTEAERDQQCAKRFWTPESHATAASRKGPQQFRPIRRRRRRRGDRAARGRVAAAQEDRQERSRAEGRRAGGKPLGPDMLRPAHAGRNRRPVVSSAATWRNSIRISAGIRSSAPNAGPSQHPLASLFAQEFPGDEESGRIGDAGAQHRRKPVIDTACAARRAAIGSTSPFVQNGQQE